MQVPGCFFFLTATSPRKVWERQLFSDPAFRPSRSFGWLSQPINEFYQWFRIEGPFAPFLRGGTSGKAPISFFLSFQSALFLFMCLFTVQLSVGKRFRDQEKAPNNSFALFFQSFQDLKGLPFPPSRLFQRLLFKALHCDFQCFECGSKLFSNLDLLQRLREWVIPTGKPIPDSCRLRQDLSPRVIITSDEFPSLLLPLLFSPVRGPPAKSIGGFFSFLSSHPVVLRRARGTCVPTIIPSFHQAFFIYRYFLFSAGSRYPRTLVLGPFSDRAPKG